MTRRWSRYRETRAGHLLRRLLPPQMRATRTS